MASCRMGPAALGGVCDAQGRPHGFTNLRLCDASVLPGATGVSPQETIMGFSHLEGVAVLRDSAEQVADAERRYAERYRQPRENPDRVVIEIAVERVLGRA